MTMQVGMVGTDGVLIASDILWMNRPEGSPSLSENQSLVRHTFGATKIIIDYERGIAISCAKTMSTAQRLANNIISKLKDEELAYPCNPIEKIGSEVLELLGSVGERREAHCLIIVERPIPRLYSFEFGDVNGMQGPICRKMEKAIAAGDHINAAVFWKERYYERKPIKQLVPLAAHLVVSASKLNSGSISGLEIVLCDADGLHRIDDDSIRKLEAKANKWDEEIGSIFAKYRQRFTFTPKDAG